MIEQNSKNEILFNEEQRFGQWWLWLILLAINGFSLSKFFLKITGQSFDHQINGTELLIFMIVNLLLLFLFLNLRLETIIKEDGIYVRFFPFHLSFIHFKWERISESFVREYNPILEYGGWGMRFGFFGKGKAYNVSGNKGIQLVFTNGRKLLIGTKRPEEVNGVLERLGYLTVNLP
jgi:hypothetical protein